MKKHKTLLLLFIALFFLTNSFIQKNTNEIRRKNMITLEAKWSGTITYTQTNKNKGADTISEIKTEWNYFYQSQATANITNNQVMATRSETTNDFVKTTSKFGKGLDQVEVRTKKISCERRDSIAATEVSVEINNKDSTYFITLSAPACSGYMHTTYTNNINELAGQPATSSSTTDIEYDVLNVNIFKQRLGNNPNVLNGQTEERIIPPGAGGEIVTIITWNLRKAR